MNIGCDVGALRQGAGSWYEIKLKTNVPMCRSVVIVAISVARTVEQMPRSLARVWLI